MSTVPPRWAEDELSQFLDIARNNAFATFQNLYGEYGRIRDIDRLFLEFFEEYRDPEDPLGATLGLRCHSALRAAAQLALSGQVPETYMLLRGALEHALYAHHASSSDERAKIWMARIDGEAERKKCSNEFSGRNIFPVLRARDERVGNIAGSMYERTIELGAHPNAMAVLSTMAMGETEEHYTFDFAYVVGDGIPLRLALKSWSQVAISCLDILSFVLPTRASELKLIERSAPMRHGI